MEKKQSRGCSIGDSEMQLDVFGAELLSDYTQTYLNLKDAKTAVVADALKALGVTKSAVLVCAGENNNLYLASRNIPKIEVIHSNLDKWSKLKEQKRKRQK